MFVISMYLSLYIHMCVFIYLSILKYIHFYCITSIYSYLDVNIYYMIYLSICMLVSFCIYISYLSFHVCVVCQEVVSGGGGDDISVTIFPRRRPSIIFSSLTLLEALNFRHGVNPGLNSYKDYVTRVLC